MSRSEHEKLETKLIMAQETIEQLQKELKLMKETQAGFQIDISKFEAQTRLWRASLGKPI